MRSLAFVLVLTGCTADGPVDNQSDATRTIDGATVTLERYPAQCGVQMPPFDDGDLYSLVVSGSSSATVAPPVIEVSFHPTLPVGQALTVALDPFGVLSYATDANGNMIDIVYGQQGTLPLSTDNWFEWDQGSDATAVDSQPIANATVMFDAMPGADNASATLTIRMVFADGGIYDAQVSAPVDETSCPAG
jgi:hypothetical protein